MNLIDALKVNGKARVRAWPSDHHVVFDGEYFIYSDTKAPFDFKFCHAYLISDDWEPLKEPCTHEPVGLICMNGKQKVGFFGSENVLMFSLQHLENAYCCKHCGKRLKATGWELA